jgi:hypothetical protein
MYVTRADQSRRKAASRVRAQNRPPLGGPDLRSARQFNLDPKKFFAAKSWEGWAANLLRLARLGKSAQNFRDFCREFGTCRARFVLLGFRCATVGGRGDSGIAPPAFQFDELPAEAQSFTHLRRQRASRRNKARFGFLGRGIFIWAVKLRKPPNNRKDD